MNYLVIDLTTLHIATAGLEKLAIFSAIFMAVGINSSFGTTCHQLKITDKRNRIKQAKKVGVYPGNKTISFSLSCVNHVTSQAHFHCLRFAYGSNESLCAFGINVYIKSN